MKTLYIFLLVCFVFNSCYFEYPMPYYDIDVPIENDLGGFDNLEDKINYIGHFVRREVKYCREEVANWQTPKETWELKKGDCEDRVILWMWLCYQYLNIEPYMVIMVYRTYTGVERCHAYGYYRGITYYKYYVYELIDEYWTDFKETIITAHYER